MTHSFYVKKLLREERADFTQKVHEASSVFLLFGSAISRPSTSNIPTVEEIKEFLLGECLSRGELGTLMRRKTRRRIEKAFRGTPFEMMWEGLRYTTEANTSVALETLMGVSAYNELHALVVRLLGERIVKGVLTTNFDYLLEQAMSDADYSSDAFNILVADKDYLITPEASGEKLSIVKIHGSLELRANAGKETRSPECSSLELIHTLSQVSLGLPDHKKKYIEGLLKRERAPLLVVIGYGGNDLDIHQVIKPLISAAPTIWCCPNDRDLNVIIKGVQEANQDRLIIYDHIDLFREEANPLNWLAETSDLHLRKAPSLAKGPVKWERFNHWISDLPGLKLDEFIYWVLLERGINAPVLETVGRRLAHLGDDTQNTKERANLLFSQARALADEHRYGQSRPVFQKVLSLLDNIKQSNRLPSHEVPRWVRILEAKATMYIAYSFRMQYNHEKADSVIDDAVSLFEILGDLEAHDEVSKYKNLRLRAEIWTVMSQIRGATVDPGDTVGGERLSKAVNRLAKVMEETAAKGYIYEYSHAVRLRGKAELARNNLTEAETFLREFQTNMYAFGTETLRGNACRNLGLLYLHCGMLEKAISQLDQADRHLNNAVKQGMTRTKVRLEKVKLYHSLAQVDIAGGARSSPSLRRGRALAKKLSRNDKVMSEAFVRYFDDLKSGSRQAPL